MTRSQSSSPEKLVLVRLSSAKKKKQSPHKSPKTRSKESGNQLFDALVDLGNVERIMF